MYNMVPVSWGAKKRYAYVLVCTFLKFRKIEH